LSTDRTEVAETRSPELSELADDAPIAPTRVLAREPRNKRLKLGVELRATDAAAVVGPVTRQEPAMPAQQRLRANGKRRPRRSRQRPAQGSEQRPVGRARSRSSKLAPRDRELMAEHKDLKLIALARAQPQRE
jgi:hypothetical protein